MLHRATGVLWTADPDLRLRFVSGAQALSLGLVAGAALADGPLAGTDAAGLAAHARALGGETVPYEVRHADAVLSCLVEPLRDDRGALVGVFGSAEDVAEHDRTADIVATQRNLLETMLDQSIVGVGLCAADGRFLFTNAALRRFAFREPTEHALGDATQVWGEWHFAERPARVEEWPLACALRGETVAPREMYRDAPDGRRDHLLIAAAPVRDPAGALLGCVVTVADITQRKRMEEETRALNDQLERRVQARTRELRQSRATLAAVIESAPDPIWAVDAQLRFLAFNAAAMALIADVTGVTPGPDAPRREQVPPAVYDRWLAYLRRSLAGERFTVEERLAGPGGTRHLLVSLTPMVEDDRVTGVAGFTKDITELMRAEEQARQHQAELAHALRLHTIGELAASLAHEVNQPLGAIANYAQGVRRRLERGGLDAADLQTSVEAIASEALRAGEITRRVRELLRKEDTPRGPVDVNEIVARAVRVAEPVARQHGVLLSVAPPTPLPLVRADAIQIEQVLFNLLLNGIEATAAAPGERVVQVRAGRAADGVEVVVADSGAGIPAELGDEIFAPFRTTKSGGLGMGLAITRSIVEAHGGRVWSAPAPARGAAFHVRLPVGEAP